MTPVTYALLVVNLLIFGLQMLLGDVMLRDFALWPLQAGFAPWQIVTCAFLHGSLMHLGTNMLGVWMFGRDVERALGSSRFAQLYAASVLTASFAQLAFTSFFARDPVPTVGASGGLFGVLAAFAWLYPRRKVILLIPPIPLPAPVFVSLYAAVELYSGVTGTFAGVAHFAHLGGLIGGLALLWIWRKPV
ncbi:MAG: rhomboid family intrarane serine protease [Hydrocarboniphaga sp.]|nr:rhomboid family intrarane serine protease [Hydrocarboniphaga sp.]